MIKLNIIYNMYCRVAEINLFYHYLNIFFFKKKLSF
jgi:hypothetical protein